MDDHEIFIGAASADDVITISTSSTFDLSSLPAIDTIDISDINLSSFNSYNYGNVTISTGATGAQGPLYTSSGMNGTWGTIGPAGITSSAGLHVNSDAVFEGDVKIKGISIVETLSKIEKRLSILRPDPEKLEHFEALRKAYEHYKTLEALCEIPPPEEEK